MSQDFLLECPAPCRRIVVLYGAYMLLAVFAHIAVLVRLMAVLGRCRAVCTVCGVAAWLPVYVAMVAVAARRSVVAVSAVMAMSSVGISETCRRAYDCHYGYHHYDKCLFHVFSLSWMSLAARCTCFFVSVGIVLRRLSFVYDAKVMQKYHSAKWFFPICRRENPYNGGYAGLAVLRLCGYYFYFGYFGYQPITHNR